MHQRMLHRKASNCFQEGEDTNVPPINSCFRLKNRAKGQHGFSINTYGIGKSSKFAHYTETSARNL